MKKIITLLLLIGALSASAAQQIFVVANESKPNLFVEDGKYMGFELDLIKEMGLDPVFLGSSNVGEIFNSSEYDMAAGALSITSEREVNYDFSIPYQNSGMKVAVLSAGDQTFWGSIVSLEYPKLLFSTLQNPIFWQIGFWFGAFVLFFSVIVWTTQRGHIEIDDNPWKGIPQAVYFCIVTSSTVGYGDITLKNVIGRICTVCLIFLGIAFFCNFTGLLSAEYSGQKAKYNIESLEDLKGLKVATKTSTTSESKAKKFGADVVTFSTFDEALAALKNKKAEAVLFDAPAIDYAAKNDSTITALGPFCQEDYGFAFPEGSELKETIDQKLLQLKESGRYEEIKNRWF